MEPCALVRDLLPLYVDGAISDESRALIDGHLKQCEGCRRELAALRAATSAPSPGLPEPDLGPSEDARFLVRLRRRAGTALGLVLVLVAVSWFGAVQYGKWAAQREAVRQYEEQRLEENAALQALQATSPPAAGLLQAAGITIETKATQTGGVVTLDYSMKTDPGSANGGSTGAGSAVDYIFMGPGDGPLVGLVDSAGNEVKHVGGRGSGSWGHGVSGSQELYYDGPAAAKVVMDLPTLLVYEKPAKAYQWNIERQQSATGTGAGGGVATGGTAAGGATSGSGAAGSDGATAPDSVIDENVTVDGVDFHVDRVVWTAGGARVLYQQLTDPTKVGVHYLSFVISDRMGNTSGSMPLERLTDPLHPYQDLQVSPFGRYWTLELDHSVLAIPDVHVAAEVK